MPTYKALLCPKGRRRRKRGYEINTSLKVTNMGKVWHGKSHTRTILVDFPVLFMIQVNS